MANEERDIEKDLAATIEARRELGPDYEVELVESFVERIDATIERRVAAEVERRVAADEEDDDGTSGSFIVALTSLGTGIPITAIANEAGLAGVAFSWLGIAAVNIAYAWGNRRR